MKIFMKILKLIYLKISILPMMLLMKLQLKTPDKIAMVWCDDKGAEATFTFGQLKYYSDKTANFFKSAVLKKVIL